MGYYNLPSAKLPDELNDLEKLLRSLSLEGAIEALDLLEKIVRNVIQNPSEEKYRRVRTTNDKLSPLFGLAGSIDIMMEMGWEQQGEFLVLPKAIQLDFPKHVVKILEAKSFFGKQRQNAKKSAKLADDPSKAAVLQQLEIDRRERAAAAGAVPKPPPQAKPQVAASPVPAPTQGQVPMPASEQTMATPKAALEADAVRGMTEEEQIQAAMKLSLEDKTPTASAQQKPKSAYDFQRRENKEQQRKEADMTLQELRALQKDKYKEFQADPTAKKGEAYQRPPSAVDGGEEPGWFDWLWGSSSSSGGGGGGGGGGGSNGRGPQGPRMKTIRDLPAPVRRGGG